MNELQQLLIEARQKGATAQQLQQIIDVYNGKKKSTTDSGNGTLETSPSKSQSSSTSGESIESFFLNPAKGLAKMNVENKLNQNQPLNTDDVVALKTFNPGAYEGLRSVVKQPDPTTLTPIEKLTRGIATPEEVTVAQRQIIENDMQSRFTLDKFKDFPLTNFAKEDVTTLPPFLPVGNTENQTDNKTQIAAILADKEKTTEYAFRRIAEEEDKLRTLRSEVKGGIDYSLYGAEGLSVEDLKKDEDRIKLNKQEQNKLSKKISELKSIGEQTIISKITDDLAKSSGIDRATPEGKVAFYKLLNTKESLERIGLELRTKTDPQFAATLENMLQNETNDYYIGSNISGSNLLGVVLNKEDKPDLSFNGVFNLLGSGDEKSQAETRLTAYNALLQSAINSNDKELLQSLSADKDKIVLENGKAKANELWAVISNQKFKEAGNSTGGLWDLKVSTNDLMGKSQKSKEILALAERAGINGVDLDIVKNVLIPDELSRTFTTNLQTSSLRENAIEGFGGVFKNVGNLFRSDNARIKENLNDDGGRLENIGQYSPFLQELDQLNSEENLSPEQQQRKSFLESNTNLLSWYQKLGAGSGDILGQVAGQGAMALMLGGVANLASKGALVASVGEGAAVGNAARAARLLANREAVAGIGTESAINPGAQIVSEISTSPTFTARALAYGKENANLYISSFINAYDGNKKMALQVFPGKENDGAREMFALATSIFEGLTEAKFKDTKIITAFKKEAVPLIANISRELSTGQLTRIAASNMLRDALLSGATFKQFGKSILKNASDEGVEESASDIFSNVASTVFLNQDFDVQKTLVGAAKTYFTMLTDGALVAGIAARGDVRNNTFNRSTVYHVASNPFEYISQITRLENSGDITSDEAKSKKQIVNTISSAYNGMIKDGLVDKNNLDDAKNASYLLHTVNQAISTENANRVRDENTKADLLASAERSKGIRKGIYTGTVNVDAFMNEVTADKKVADELNIEHIPIVPTPIAVQASDEKVIPPTDKLASTAPQLRTDPLNEEEAKTIIEPLSAKEKASFVKMDDAAKNEFLLQKFNEQNPTVSKTVTPEAAPLNEFAAGNKVTYQGVEYTISNTYQTPQGQQSFELKDSEGNVLASDNGKPKYVAKSSLNTVVTPEIEATKFIPNETQFTALDRLTKGIQDLPEAEQAAEIKRRADEHDASYQQFISKEGSVTPENKKIERVNEFGKLTGQAMKKFMDNPKQFEGEKQTFENGSRIDENGDAINENDFVTLKEKVKQLRKVNNIDEIKQINDNPRKYLNEKIRNIVPTENKVPKEQGATANVSENIGGLSKGAAEAPATVLTQEAIELLDKVKSGGIPAFMTANLKKVAADNGIEVTDKTKPDDVVRALENKKASSTSKNEKVEGNSPLRDVESTAKALETESKNKPTIWEQVKEFLKGAVKKVGDKLGIVSNEQHLSNFEKAKQEWDKLSPRDKKLKRADYELDDLEHTEGGYYKVGNSLIDLDLNTNHLKLLLENSTFLNVLNKLGVTKIHGENRPAEEMFAHYSDNKIHLNNNSAFENIRQVTNAMSHELGHHEWTKLTKEERNYVRSLPLETGMAKHYEAQEKSGKGKETSASLQEENFADYVMQYFQGKLYGDEALLNKIPTKLRELFDNKYSDLLKDNEHTEASEAYHKAKADGSNPELVKAVESLLSKEQTLNDNEKSKTNQEAGSIESIESKAKNAESTGNIKEAENVIKEIDESIQAVTLSGLTKAERDAVIEKRKSETKANANIIASNELMRLSERYNAMRNGRLGKNRSEGLALLNKIRIAAKELGVNVEGKPGQFIILTKNKAKGGTSKLRNDNRADGNKSLVNNESDAILSGRGEKVASVFNTLYFSDFTMPLSVYGEDGRRLSDAQLVSAYEDIADGVPSKQAKAILDVLEKGIKEDSLPFNQADMQDWEMSIDEIQSLSDKSDFDSVADAERLDQEEKAKEDELPFAIQNKQELIAEAKKLAETDVLKISREGFINNTEQGLIEVAEQANDPLSYNGAVKFYGQRIVDIALQLYPNANVENNAEGNNFVSSQKINTDENGNITLERLQPIQEKGRSESGEINAISTIITSAVHSAVQEKQGISNPNAYGKIKQLEEEALRRHAEDNGLMVGIPNTEILDSGNESDVYLSDDPKKVIKVNNANNNNSWLELFDSIAVHNSENPTTKYTITGFAINKDGNFSVVLEQNKIIGTPATFDKIHRSLIEQGYELYGEYGDGSYINNGTGVILEDVKEDNVIEDTDGKLNFIDTNYYINTAQKGGSIILEYPNYAAVGQPTTSEAEQKGVSKIIEFFNKQFGFTGFAPFSEFASKLKSLGYSSLQAMVEGGEVEGVQFLGSPSGTVLGFVSGGKIYLNPNALTAKTAWHELAHVQQELIQLASEQGDTKAAAVLTRYNRLMKAYDVMKQYNEKGGKINIEGKVIDLSNKVYGKGKNESDAAHEQRIRNEVWSYLISPEVAKRWDKAIASNPVKRFIDAVVDYFKNKLGLQGLTNKQILNSNLKDLIEHTSNGLIKGEWFDLQNKQKETVKIQQAYQIQMPDGTTKTVKSINADVVNGFYSPLEKVINDAKQDKLPAKQWVEKFARGEEAKWTGLTDWLGQQQGSVSKKDIQNYLKDNRIEIVEVVKGGEQKVHFNIKAEKGKSVVYKNGVKDKEFDTYDKADDYVTNYKESEVDATKFSQYQIEGEKENYKEVLVTMPVAKSKQEYVVEQDYRTPNLFYAVNQKTGVKLKFDSYELAKSQAERLSKEAQPDFEKQFKSSHFDEPNILVHLRMNTRTDSEGNKVLFLEEVQSDWGQKGKKDGFEIKEEDRWNFEPIKRNGETVAWKIELKSDKNIGGIGNTKEDAIKDANKRYGTEINTLEKQQKGAPSAPFVTDTNAWTKLGLKVAIKEAVKQGADKIAWTTGEQQNERYDLSKQVDYVTKHNENRVNKEDNSIDVTISVNNGLMGVVVDKATGKIKSQNGSSQFGDFKGKGLDEVIGKDVADRILKLDDTEHKLQGEGLKVGGKGMKGFYGQPEENNLGIVGNVAKSLFKQEPKTTEINTSKNVGKDFTTQIPIFDTEEERQDWVDNQNKKSISTQHSIDITPELKLQVEEGLPMFAIEPNKLKAEVEELRKEGMTDEEIKDFYQKYSTNTEEEIDAAIAVEESEDGTPKDFSKSSVRKSINSIGNTNEEVALDSIAHRIKVGAKTETSGIVPNDALKLGATQYDSQQLLAAFKEKYKGNYISEMVKTIKYESRKSSSVDRPKLLAFGILVENEIGGIREGFIENIHSISNEELSRQNSTIQNINKTIAREGSEILNIAKLLYNWYGMESESNSLFTAPQEDAYYDIKDIVENDEKISKAADAYESNESEPEVKAATTEKKTNKKVSRKDVKTRADIKSSMNKLKNIIDQLNCD